METGSNALPQKLQHGASFAIQRLQRRYTATESEFLLGKLRGELTRNLVFQSFTTIKLQSDNLQSAEESSIRHFFRESDFLDVLLSKGQKVAFSNACMYRMISLEGKAFIQA